MDKPLYIISTGRTGSTFFTKLLNKNGEERVEHQQSGSRRLNIVSNISWQLGILGKVEENMLTKRFGDGNTPFSTTDPLKSVALTNYLKGKPQLEANIIILIRDPRTFVSSFMNWKSSSMKKRFLHYFTPFWQPMTIVTGKAIRLNKFKHFCWIWTLKNSFFLHSFAHDKRALVIKYEDLMSENTRIRTLEAISSHIGADLTHDTTVFNKKINNSERKVFPNWRKWNNRISRTLHEYCSVLMSELNYGNEDEWKNRFRAMRILFEITHPKHFHQFKNLIKVLEKEHTIKVIARDKDVVVDLLKKSGLQYDLYGAHGKTMTSKFLLIPNLLRSYKRILKGFNPILLLAGHLLMRQFFACSVGVRL